VFGNVTPRVVSFTIQILTHRQPLREGTESSSFLLLPCRSTLREKCIYISTGRGRD